MKYLHTMLRVGDLEKSIQFYCEILNFELIRRCDFPEGQFTLAFLKARGDQNNTAELELTYNWGVNRYEIGTGYGHLAYQVESIDVIKNRLNDFNLQLSWGPGKTPNGKQKMAFLTDPDGYKIELLE
ncbi:VOC family protein [Fluviispira vulneris]|uniref:VOC family protein n=1 Tax=Fluviispira vulneris TaxID=2763012 RepID=UPI001649566C|nr:VOC family protein [Fluviispira vulneris]